MSVLKLSETQTKLTREQKEAVGLLSIGTFLEYFDLMLYVHMAVLLNDLFFPKTDPFTKSLISALGFCTTFVFRPIGALVFGYIGDKIGRKITIIITTFFMAMSCLIIMVLPTYAQIGITASWMITVCRILQGMSSMGEIVGAELYVTEMSKPPIRYPLTAFIGVAAALGGSAALLVGYLVTNFNPENWRLIFAFGLVIAILGTVARTRLRETPDFANAQKFLQKSLEQQKQNEAENIKLHPAFDIKVNQRTTLAFFLIQCAYPVCFFFVYIHCSGVLESKFHYTPSQIMKHNLIIALIQACVYVFLTYLSYCVHPIKILFVLFGLSSVFIAFSPYFFSILDSPERIMLLQAVFVCIKAGELPAGAVFFKHFPIFKRFTYASTTFAISRALMSVINSFGMIQIMNIFGNMGLVVFAIPIYAGYLFGLMHFRRLEIQDDSYKL